MALKAQEMVMSGDINIETEDFNYAEWFLRLINVKGSYVDLYPVSNSMVIFRPYLAKDLLLPVQNNGHYILNSKTVCVG